MKAASRLAPSRAQRIAMRQAWVRETAHALREAHRSMNRRCDAAVRFLDDEALSQLIAAEQEKVDAFRLPLVAVAERDVWPKELHWGGI